MLSRLSVINGQAAKYSNSASMIVVLITVSLLLFSARHEGCDPAQPLCRAQPHTAAIGVITPRRRRMVVLFSSIWRDVPHLAAPYNRAEDAGLLEHPRIKRYTRGAKPQHLTVYKHLCACETGRLLASKSCIPLQPGSNLTIFFRSYGR